MGELKDELSEQEANLYDRQIRLWGLESQKKLRGANVLLAGVGALGAEIAKNILLSGIKSLTILDHHVVTNEDLHSNFLLGRETLGKNCAEAALERAKHLNPMVELSADPSTVDDKDAIFYKQFSIIIASRLSAKQLISINQICRQNGTQFICGDVFGQFGYTFSDFQIHQYIEDITQFVGAGAKHNKRKHKQIEKAEQEIVRKVKTVTYVPLQDALGVDWTAEEQRTKSHKLPLCYFILRVLLKFRDTYNRDLSTSPNEKESELEKLKEIRDDLMKTLGLVNEAEVLPDSTLNLLFGEVVPVCAVVGGTLAQEVIKALTHHEPPINNMFFFDPNHFTGKIQCIGN